MSGPGQQVKYQPDLRAGLQSEPRGTREPKRGSSNDAQRIRVRFGIGEWRSIPHLRLSWESQHQQPAGAIGMDPSLGECPSSLGTSSSSLLSPFRDFWAISNQFRSIDAHASGSAATLPSYYAYTAFEHAQTMLLLRNAANRIESNRSLHMRVASQPLLRSSFTSAAFTP